MDILSLKKRAFELFWLEKYSDSANLFDELISYETEQEEYYYYYYYLGLCFFCLNEVEKCQEIWMSVLFNDSWIISEDRLSALIKILTEFVSLKIDKRDFLIAYSIYLEIVNLSPEVYQEKFNIFKDKSWWNEQILNLMNNNNFLEAINYIELILKAEPEESILWNYLAVCYYKVQEYIEAIKAINQAISLNSTNSIFEYNAGLILTALGENNQAISAYKKAIELDKNNIGAYLNLSNIYIKNNQLIQAKEVLEKGYKVNNLSLPIAFNLFDLLNKLGKGEEAKQIYIEREKLFPNEVIWKIAKYLTIPIIYNNNEEIIKVRNKFAEGLKKIKTDLESDLKDKTKQTTYLEAIQHHNNFYLCYQGFNDIEFQKQYGEIVEKIIKENLGTLNFSLERKKVPSNNKIKIGFISPQFHEHASTKWLLSWLENINKTNFEVYCYHLGSTIDNTTHKFRQFSDFFFHIVDSVERAIELVKSNRLDILVYPHIGMDSFTVALACVRLAPIQCNSWGHPVTSGLSNIDYYISNELMEPDNGQEHYSEKLICLPNLGFSYPKPSIPETLKNRTDLGLGEDKTIYMCCQSIFKYLPQYDYIFPQIAKKVKSAQFVYIKDKNICASEIFEKRIENVFSEANLQSKDFCLFLPRVGFDDYLNRNTVSDIYLDTLDFSGANTALHAIACHLPIVTYAGQFMRGRLAYGVLKMLGIEETIAYSVEEYINIAIRLALDLDWKEKIVNKIIAYEDKVFNDKSWVPTLENFFEKKFKDIYQQTL
ncbi:tetratricopeptide repeat protein [Cyanobacterium aponinum UTEX 3222]|uniref:O-linked N-acetylglucosamine transferase, SPINDLY family protein n=1 Tax=Cyanobacterium aponinum TaxID=379064 RepID=UPI003093D23C|nr:tetratricopeptide repeat protein [Cyanobacterium aponinum UTEX 3222]